MRGVIGKNWSKWKFSECVPKFCFTVMTSSIIRLVTTYMHLFDVWCDSILSSNWNQKGRDTVWNETLAMETKKISKLSTIMTKFSNVSDEFSVVGCFDWRRTGNRKEITTKKKIIIKTRVWFFWDTEKREDWEELRQTRKIWFSFQRHTQKLWFSMLIRWCWIVCVTGDQ